MTTMPITPQNDPNRPALGRPGFISREAAEMWWVQQSKRNLGMFITYINGKNRAPASHHLEWLYNILNPQHKRILIVAPRESAKTTLAVNVIAWYIGHYPLRTNLITSVSSDQAEDRIDMLKQLIDLPRYKNVFPHIHMDYNKPSTKSEFTVWSDKHPMNGKDLTYRDYRVIVPHLGDPKNPTISAAGITSAKIIGKRISGLALVDDPHDSNNSATADQCAKVEKYFVENVLGGMQHTGKVVVITTRWAEEDLAGRLMAKKSAAGEPVWKVIQTKAIDDNGDSYWPEYWTLDLLQQKREEVGEIMFQTMYMNNPIGASSGMFKMEYLTQDVPEILPDFDKIVVTTDLAKSKTAASDYSVIAIVAKDKSKPFKYYVLDLIRLKTTFSDALREIERVCEVCMERYGKLDGVLFESPNDLGSAQELKERRLDLPVMEVPLKGDKGLRLANVAIKAQGGNLFINQKMDTAYVLKSELLGFPKAAHDDTCDAISLPLQLASWSNSSDSGIIRINSPLLL